MRVMEQARMAAAELAELMDSMPMGDGQIADGQRAR
jgi:hypothetical protein